MGKIPADHYGLCDYKYISVNADMPEIGTIHADSKVLVFPSKVYLTAEAKQDSGFNLKARLRHVDLNQSGQEFSYAEESFLRGPVANSQIKGPCMKKSGTRLSEASGMILSTKRSSKPMIINVQSS